MSNLIGQSLGRYHILEGLGEGGMAIVYKAYDTRLESEVAVKVIRIERLAPEILQRAMKRFEREAKSLAQLTHPNLVKVLDYGEYEGQPYLVMPYLMGGTLKQKLKGQPMPWQEAARLLIPIARALDYAHKRGLIHRDVKPSNILITESGEPMLTDFGVAKIIDEGATVDLTGTSAAVGTPEYMAPEQATSKNLDHRADIYALGIVFYEMVTGRRPFQADTPLAVLFKQATEALPRPTQFIPTLPAEVEKILVKALAKKPEDRYQSAGEMVHSIETLLSGVAPAARPQPEIIKPKATAPREKTRDTLAMVGQTGTISTVDENEEATVDDKPVVGAQKAATKLEKRPAQGGILRYWPVAVGGLAVICIGMIALIISLILANSENATSQNPFQEISTFSATLQAANIEEPINTIIESAKNESMLSTIALPHDWANYGEILETFKQKYGIELNELNPDAGSGDQLEAIRANRGSFGLQAPDVIDISVAYAPSAKGEGLLLPYKVSTWDSIPMKDNDGYWWAAYYGFLTFEINTDYVSTSPSDWSDLLKPEYKGKVALSGNPQRSNQAVMTVLGSGMARAGLTEIKSNDDAIMAAQAGLEFWREMYQIGNFIPPLADQARIATGETPITVEWSYLSLANRDALSSNSTIEIVVPKAGVIAGPYVGGISAYAPHPNAAKLWWEFVMSDEGQLLYLKGYAHPIRYNDMANRGVIPENLAAKLPPAKDAARAVFIAVEYLTTAKNYITENWMAVVGVDQ